jgi:aspartyl-tRNA(Asn)/glutamyl-tRNA(Gln) amidotransferase subunit C
MLSREDIEHLATLARLELTEQEKEVFPKQLSDVVGFIKAVTEIETTDVARDFTNVNTMRDDVARTKDNAEERERIMGEMPEIEKDLLKVPKIL